jgi:hypothetical protein
LHIPTGGEDELIMMESYKETEQASANQELLNSVVQHYEDILTDKIKMESVKTLRDEDRIRLQEHQ